MSKLSCIFNNSSVRCAHSGQSIGSHHNTHNDGNIIIDNPVVLENEQHNDHNIIIDNPVVLENEQRNDHNIIIDNPVVLENEQHKQRKQHKQHKQYKNITNIYNYVHSLLNTKAGFFSYIVMGCVILLLAGALIYMAMRERQIIGYYEMMSYDDGMMELTSSDDDQSSSLSDLDEMSVTHIAEEISDDNNQNRDILYPLRDVVSAVRENIDEGSLSEYRV